MSWKLLGLVPIIRVAGPDVARSAAGRAAAEAVWVPTALLPRHGAHWRAREDHSVVADFAVGDEQVSRSQRHSVRVQEFLAVDPRALSGGPEVFRYEDLPDPTRGPNNMLIQVAVVLRGIHRSFRRAGVWCGRRRVTACGRGRTRS